MYWTEIALAITTLLTASGWFVDGRKHRRQIEAMAIENRQKEMDLAKTYIDEFKANIAAPLQDRLRECNGELNECKTQIKGLRRDVKNLQKAINTANSCPHADGCPVLGELQRQSDSCGADC